MHNKERYEKAKHTCYGVICEYRDLQAQLAKFYTLKFFDRKPAEIEIVDRNTKRLFLKRTVCPDHILASDLYIGNSVNLFGRILSIIDYADPYTRSVFEGAKQACVAVVTNDAMHALGKILEALSCPYDRDRRLQLSQLRMLRLTAEEVQKLSKLQIGSNQLDPLVALIQKDVVAIELIGQDCIHRVKQASAAIRDKYAAGISEPAIYTGDKNTSPNLANLLFRDHQQLEGDSLSGCTCGLIRPHALGKVGQIVDRVLQSGFHIQALKSFKLDLQAAMEFLGVYRGVVPEYKDSALELTEGPVIGIALRSGSTTKSVTDFRRLCGPWDIEMAKALRPESLRADYGVDRVRNGVHCTDLVEDADLECRYLFENKKPDTRMTNASLHVPQSIGHSA